MRRTKSASRSRQINVCVYDEEFNLLGHELKQSTFQYMSELVRAKLLAKPVILKYRSETADEFLQLALDIKHRLLILIESNPQPDSDQIAAELSHIKLTMNAIYKQLLKNTPSRK